MQSSTSRATSWREMTDFAPRFQLAARFRVALALLICASGCQPKGGVKHPVAERAPRDLGCPEADVQTRTVGEEQAEAWGCGIKATYFEYCQSTFDPATSATVGMPTSRKKCQWQLESREPEQ